MESRYTLEQQLSTEERIVYAADLIKAGATINQFGTLAVTQSQLVDFQSENDRFTESAAKNNSFESLIDPEFIKPDLEAWLDKSIRELVDQAETSEDKIGSPIGRKVIYHTLARNGVCTVRNLLVFGKDRIGELRGIGEGLVDVAEKITNNNPFGFALKAKPSTAEVRTLCQDLTKVTVGAVFKNHSHTIFADLSLAEVIDETPEQLASTKIPESTKAERSIFRASWIIENSRQFVEELSED